jgi:TolB-like protein/class 3 adenylate cyclase/tetratricopeptide (TPR) repeat protein
VAERRLAAILFTDIVGYTALMAESEEKGLRARRRHREVVRPLVERYAGEWIEAPGDESLSTFHSALDAVNAGLAILAALRDDAELKLHVGIHSGDIVVSDGEISGDGVNIAARLCSMSEGDALCVSGEVHRSIRNQPGIDAKALGEQTLKNVPEPVAVYAVSGTAAPPRRVSWAAPLLRTVRRWPIQAAALLVLVALAAAWWAVRPFAEPLPIRSIAVLPLENLSDDPEREYFADGLTEALIGELAKIGSLRVISRTSSMQFKDARSPLPEIAEQLGVQGVIEGTVIHEGDRVRVTVQLLDAREDVHLWSDRYDRDLGGMLALQSELAQAVAAEVRAKLTPEEREALRAPQVDPRAYDAYVRGLELSGRVAGGPTELDAIRALERAVELDPSFAQAYARLATSRMLVASQYLRPAEERAGMLPAAVQAANRALELDERQGLAHSTIGLVRLFQWDSAGAGTSLERAVQLSPGDPAVLSNYNWYLLMVGRLDEARQVAERLRLVAPLDPVMMKNVARSFFYTRDYARALDEYERALELDEGVDTYELSPLYHQLGRMEEAHEAEIRLSRRYARRGLPGRERMVEAAQRGWDEGGIEGHYRAVLQVQIDLASQGLFSPYAVAMGYCRLGEIDQAFAWLERSYEAREAVLYNLRSQPFADVLRSDPRFQDLLRRVGFPES